MKRIKANACLLTIAILIAIYPPISVGLIGFEDRNDAIVIVLEPPVFSSVTNLSVPVGSYATGAMMRVSGMNSDSNSSAYPVNVSLGINGTEIWGFGGPAYGQLGRQDIFFNGRKNVELEFGKDGGSSETRIRLPKTAIVQSAGLDIMGGPKFIAQELVNFTGDQQNAALGISVSGGGDINGDGYDDVIASFEGQVNIYFGGPVMNQTPDVELRSNQAVDRFGVTVSNAGDVNNDGYDDVIVGASWGEPENQVDHTGKVYLYLGGPIFDNQSDWSICGLNQGDEIGRTVAGAGDVNGDGYDDFIINVEKRDYIYIVLGAPDLNNLSTIVLSIPGLMHAISVAGAGDLNNDGYDDVVVGDPYRGTGSNSMGEVYIFFGGEIMDSSSDLIINDTTRFSHLGTSVSGAGDMNHDGYDDIIVLAIRDNDSMPGAAYVYLGGPLMDNISDYTFTGIYSLDDAGPQSVACAGDVNGDGCDDALAGAYFESRVKSEAGAAFLYYGGENMDARADWSFAGASEGDHFGYAVAGAGDVNSDGFDDFIISAPLVDSGGQDTGRVYVYSLFNTTFRGPVNSTLKIGAKSFWSHAGVFDFKTTVTSADFADGLNQYLRATAPSGTDGFGNEYVDVSLIGFAQTVGTLRLSNLTIVYDCDFGIGDFSAPLNQYLFANQWNKDTEGNILVPVNVSSTSAGRVKLFGLNFTWDLPPAQVKEFDGLALDEDTAIVTLADLYNYFEDDIEASSDLKYSIVSATNSTFVRLWLTAGRYLSADAITGDANDNWTGTVEAVMACTDHWGRTTESRSFTITVRNVNDAPFIDSVPVVEGWTGVPYYYNVSAVDGDGDAVEFSLSEEPANMSIDSSVGRITWVPEWKGLYGVTVVASDGVLSGSQSFEIYVPNSAPRITDATVPEALVGVPWNFTVPAVDDDGDTLAFSILAGMKGMTIDSGSGTVSWTPPEPGNYTVTVGVSDGEANVTHDFGIAVVQGNRAPVFTSEPARNATVGVLYAYNVKAGDPDSDPVVFSIMSGPPGMTIDESTGIVNWMPTASGNFTVRLFASDGKDGEAFQEFSIRVIPRVLPTINIATPSEGETVRGKILVMGNVTKGSFDIVKIQIRIDDGEWLDLVCNTTWQFALDTKELDNGRHIIQARAYDGKEYSKSFNRTVLVNNTVSNSEEFNTWYIFGVFIVIVIILILVLNKRHLRRDSRYK